MGILESAESAERAHGAGDVDTVAQQPSEPLPPEAIQASSQSSASTTCSQTSTVASGARSQASTIVSTRQSTIEYVCIRKWTPRPEDRDCIRLIQGERVVLESETLSGWGIGTVVPEVGESPRSGHFPRWALSATPAPEPIHFTPGTNAMVIDEFQAPASGYLSTHMNEVLVIKYQADPFVWVWAEDRADPNRRGWVPEAVLRLV